LLFSPAGQQLADRLCTLSASGTAMLPRIEAHPTTEHQLYLVLFVTNGGGV
jgi:hypothetical protein